MDVSTTHGVSEWRGWSSVRATSAALAAAMLLAQGCATSDASPRSTSARASVAAPLRAVTNSANTPTHTRRAADEPWKLGEVLERIASGSPTLGQALARIDQARAAVREARASYAPELSLQVDFVATDDPAQAFALLLNQERLSLGPAFDPTPGSTRNWREQVRLDWPLFAPGRSQAHAAAREGELAARAQGEAIERRLLNAGVQSWLALRAALELERVAQESIAAVEQRLEQTRVRAREGAALQADVLRLEVRVAASRDEAAKAQYSVARARNALAALMNVRAEDLQRVDAAPIEVGANLAPELAQLLERARRERSDLVAMGHRVRTAELASSAREAERLPSLGLFASYAFDDEELRLDSDLDKYLVGVGLRVPLSARTGPRIEGAQAQERVAVLELRALELEVEREVRDAWAEQAAARQSLALAQSAVQAAEEAFRVLSLAQDAGGATVTDVLEAQDALNLAKVRGVAAAAGVQLARARLVAAIGGVQ